MQQRRRRLPRLVRYLIAIPLLTPISMTVLLLGGPVWTDQQQDAPDTPRLAALERAYQARLGDTPVVIVDLPALVRTTPEPGSPADPDLQRRVKGHIAARLNAHGNYVNTLWPADSRRVARRMRTPNAQTLWFAGGRHGSGALGHLSFTPAVVVMPGEPFTASTHPSIEQGFIGLKAPVAQAAGRADWMRFILFHELEHAVDKAQHGRLSASLVGGLRRKLAGAGLSGILPDDPLAITGGEIFADLGAAVRLIRTAPDRGEAISRVATIARLRALGPLWLAATGRAPYLGHFTSLALFDLLRDLEAGHDAILELDGDALTKALDARRRRTMSDLRAIDVGAFDPGHPGIRSLHAAVADFARAGAPRRLVAQLRTTARWYDRESACYTEPRTPVDRIETAERARHGRAGLAMSRLTPGITCRHIDNDGTRSWIDLPAEILMAERSQTS